MRKVKRGIALLLTVCFLFTGNVFAEEELGLEAVKPDAAMSEDFMPEEPASYEPVSEDRISEELGSGDVGQLDHLDEKSESMESYPQEAVSESKAEDAPKELQTSVVEGQVTITGLAVQEGKFQIAADGFGDNEALIQEIRFGVWNEQNGKDSLIWNTVKEPKDGRFILEVDIADYNYSTGTYYVSAYAKLVSGEELLIGGTECRMDIVLAEPEIEVVHENLEYVFSIKDFQVPGGAEKVLFSLWSEEGGQDNLQWFTAEEMSQGEYAYRWLVRENKDVGRQNIDVYVQNRSGQRLYIGSAAFDITESVVSTVDTDNEVKGAGKSQLKKLGGSKNFYVEETKNGFDIYLSNINIPGGEEEVLFPVWSKGRNEVKWYSASKMEDGTYFCGVNLKNYQGLGAYVIDAYAKNKNEILYYLGKASYMNNGDAIGNVEIEPVNRGQGTFTVRLSGVTNAEMIKSIKVPVWSEPDQSDMVWYTARKTWIGDYVVDVDIRNHQYNAGVYNIHCYMEDTDGVLHGIGTYTCDMQVGYDSIEAIDLDGTENEYSLIINGLEVPGGENEVLFAVWGDKDGQNDLQWYYADWWADREYGKVINVGSHKEPGLYHVDAYVKNRNDKMQYVGKTSFEVSQIPLSAGLEVTNVDETRGVFTVTISGLFALSGINRVQIPMWCEEDQSDIYWYDAIKVAEGMYTVEMNVANHRHHFGDYKIHAYVTMGNGVRVFSGSTVANISPSNYFYSNRVSEAEVEVWLLGVWGERVQFPTWSNENGQDDIVWYEGTDHGYGTWSALIDSANHNDGGDYTTHAYVTENGNTYYAGQTEYYLEQMPADIRHMHLLANMYSSPTPYLILVDTGAHKVGVFQGMQGSWKYVNFWDCANGAPATPTVKGVFSVGSRGYYFNSGAYRCYWWTQFYNDYLFHSVLYDWNGVLQDGRVGMALSHGCVRLEIDNAKWIYDTIPSGTTVVVY